MEITKDLVSYVASLSRLTLSEEETAEMQKQLGSTVSYMERLNELNTEGIEPMSHIFPVKSVMREDEVVPSFDREKLLSNAPDHTEETYVVPKTVE